MTESTFSQDDFEDQVERFDQAWQENPPAVIDDFLPPPSTPTVAGFGQRELLVELIMIDLECRWRRPVRVVCPTDDLPQTDAEPAGDALPDRPLLEDYLKRYPDLGFGADLSIELVVQEYHVRHRWGDHPRHETYVNRFPQLADSLSRALTEIDRRLGITSTDDVSGADTKSSATTKRKGTPAAPSITGSPLPNRIGRYQVVRLLGKGGFGLVYLARDVELDRRVAIKVPHAALVLSAEVAEMHLAEARAVASLDHPNIVPVHDVGATDDSPCFIVSKFIEGVDLATKMKVDRPNALEASTIAATIADALHYAHTRRIVHRDVKPANILIDKDGKPFIVDFGLALRDQDSDRVPQYAGTPTYMSPEQARGEGHRVDGRSDIFSLGIVLYEMLVGRRPFIADTRAEVLDQVVSHEPKPLRQLDESVPRELERICFKAISKPASQRYLTAKDMADDLWHFLGSHTVHTRPESGETRVQDDVPPAAAVFDNRPIRVIPKGLRSFDAHDADFFLELLPGARDRDGLPESLRFWKQRIEETDPDNTFSVGLIYGPSGCGKSSLIKAGLLPRLSSDVIPVYVEATPHETETRLLNGLRKRCPALEDNLSLKETLAALRRGHGVPVGSKVLIVLDQLEQWLHSGKDDQNSELVQSLRQCDGGRVQCILMVRDDFWLAVSRFMRDLEVRLVEGQNSALVDLFDRDHARQVLAAYGHAFGRLPERLDAMTADQSSFLQQAVDGLADDGKVICVRLALFAEMTKGKSWTPSTLREMGGTTGVGVTFLEETFSASTAPPQHRYLQQAARAILQALLPDSGTDIKGRLRSYNDLLHESGCGQHPQDFPDLIRLLDSELRLITPSDPEGVETDQNSSAVVESGQKYYHLTHDHLVHSLRVWLSRKQRETRQGRAEIRLAERSALWNAKPENRHLPSWWESFNIWLSTDRRKWNKSQQKMMRAARRDHGVRFILIAALAVAASTAGLTIRNAVFAEQRRTRLENQEQEKATRAQGLVNSLLHADTVQVPEIVAQLELYRRWSVPLLETIFEKAENSSVAKLHAALALLPVDESKIEFLLSQMLAVTHRQFPIVRDALLPHKQAVVEPLWQVAGDSNQDSQRRFQAACALASYDPDAAQWNQIDTFVAARLVNVQPSHLATWQLSLRPAMPHLSGPLGVIYRDPQENQVARTLATDTLASFEAEQPDQLFGLLADSEHFQFPVVFTKLMTHSDRVVKLATEEIDKVPADDASEDDKEHLAKRQANAAVTLLLMGKAERVWPLLQRSPDTRRRNYLIHWISPLAVDFQAISQRFYGEADISIRCALVLCMGEFDVNEIPIADREPLIAELLAIYKNAPDAGLHAAAGWLLRAWQHGDKILATDRELQLNDQQLQHRLATSKKKWYVGMQGQTFVILNGNEFFMGSPNSERHRDADETLHRRRIARRFAISSMEVTNEQFGRFRRERPEIRTPSIDQWVKTDDSPAAGMTWYEATAYCNWLSDQEGISEDQWCYITNEQGKFAAGMSAKANFLELTGYRLPTEAEWEFACRGGSSLSWSFGSSDMLLSEYAWYQSNSQNRTWPVGQLKPNDFGSFDMHGNILEWCHDREFDYPVNNELAEDRPDIAPVVDEIRRTIRGGPFTMPPMVTRAADRYWLQPTTWTFFIGLRPARTLR